MNFYFAPLEGITGYIYRNAYNEFWGKNIDKYFAPFIVPTQSRKLKSKEQNDILPEHNQGLRLIPQLLTNKSADFIAGSKMLKTYGYNEINLNLGCPSGTVVSKGRGSGFLAKTDELDQFLYEIYDGAVTDISIKTRIGKDNSDEFYELLQIFNKYPIKELIIHPRVQLDYYKNSPNMTVFKEAIVSSRNKVVYNGDIFTRQKYADLLEECPNVDTLMLGRGLIGNPGLIDSIKDGMFRQHKMSEYNERLREFMDRVCEDYSRVLSGDKHVLHKMKEIWCYMAPAFSNNEKYIKKIKKSESLNEYKAVISSLFREQDLYF